MKSVENIFILQKIKAGCDLGKYEFNPLRYELKLDTNVKKLYSKEADLHLMLLENRNGITNRKTS
jgi:hypothetical protein